MNTIYKNITYLFICLFAMFIGGCSSNDSSIIGGDGDGDGETGSTTNGYFRLYINVPKENMPTRTRSVNMSDNDTYKVDFNNTKIYLFKDDKFFKSCAFDASKVKYDDFSNNYEVLIKNIDETATVDFVFVANYDSSEPIKDQSKADYLASLTFNLNGAWDVETPRLIPMWGEAKDVKLDPKVGIVGYKDAKLQVKLIRSLARVDIHLSDDANVTLKEVYLFRSNNKAFVAPLASNIEDGVVKAVTVPGGVGYNSDSTPEAKENRYLYFDQLGAIGNDGLTLIPEQKASQEDPNANICLVVKLSSDACKEKSYYRLDFSKKSGDKNLFIDVSRNYRYVFNINRVSGCGYKTPEEAANNPSYGIMVDIIKFDLNINEAVVSGDKYFATNTSEIIVFSTGLKSEEAHRIDYSTNYPTDSLKVIQDSIKWGNYDDVFKAEFDTRNHKIVITPLKDNFTGENIEDFLNVKVNNHDFVLRVIQKSAEPKAEILCDETTVLGTYKVGSALTSANKMVVTIASDSPINKGVCQIETNEVNGMKFTGSANIKLEKNASGLYVQKIELKGSGTPNVEENSNFDITIVGQTGLCSASVEVKANKSNYHFGPKFVLGLGVDGGEPLASGNFVKFITSSTNFGTDANSTVGIEPLIQLSSGQTNIPEAGGYLFRQVKNQNYSDCINGYNRLPDIILLGNKIRGDQQLAKPLLEYMKKGGCVVIMMDNEQDPGALLGALGVSASPQRVNGNSNSYAIYDESKLGDDYIFTGPFQKNGAKNMAGLRWGASGSTVGSGNMNGVPCVIYSNTAPKKNGQSDDRGAGIWRYTDNDKNLIFIGSSEFLKDDLFVVDGQGRPTSTILDGVTIDNSTIFANILTWALERAENNGITKK